MPSLPPFRADQPTLWFVQVDAAFSSRRIIDQVRMYHHVLYCLPQPVLDRVADLLADAEPPSNAYQQLKERLLQEYEVSAFKRIPHLLATPPLGGQSPSDLLTAMLKLCPKAEQGGLLFRYLFYSRLPRWVQIGLPLHETQPLREMALQADGLVAGGAPDGHTVAAVEQPEDPPAPVAAISKHGSGKGKEKRHKRYGGQKRKADGDGRGDGGKRREVEPEPWRDIGVCRAHYTYGKAAYSCRPPCLLSGN